jgi:molybdopterin-guanine dinucleotide biosynthesis protein A
MIKSRIFHFMPQTISRAAIIAGGASRRMGTSKALLRFDDEVLIARVAAVLRPLFEAVLVVTADEAVARAAHLPHVADLYEDKGPLGGVHAALKYFAAPTFCFACDLPFLRTDVIEDLCAKFQQSDDCDLLAPRVAGRMETLHAIYAPSCLPTLEAALQNERVPRAARVLAPLRLRFVEEDELRRFDPTLKFLTNLNTPEEVRAASGDQKGFGNVLPRFLR